MITKMFCLEIRWKFWNVFKIPDQPEIFEAFSFWKVFMYLYSQGFSSKKVSTKKIQLLEKSAGKKPLKF